MTANNQENEEGTEATKVQSETENTSAENVAADDLTDTAATLDGGEATTDWEAKYNELVPVLLHGEHEICHWHLDEAALRAYLEAQAAN